MLSDFTFGNINYRRHDIRSDVSFQIRLIIFNVILGGFYLKLIIYCLPLYHFIFIIRNLVFIHPPNPLNKVGQQQVRMFPKFSLTFLFYIYHSEFLIHSTPYLLNKWGKNGFHFSANLEWVTMAGS